MYLNNVNIALHEANYFFFLRRKKRSAIIGCFSSSFFSSIGLPEIYKYRKDKGVTIPFSICLNTLKILENVSEDIVPYDWVNSLLAFAKRPRYEVYLFVVKTET